MSYLRGDEVTFRLGGRQLNGTYVREADRPRKHHTVKVAGITYLVEGKHLLKTDSIAHDNPNVQFKRMRAKKDNPCMTAEAHPMLRRARHR